MGFECIRLRFSMKQKNKFKRLYELRINEKLETYKEESKGNFMTKLFN